ncbi:hypothetical protein OF117_07770 [Geodermatophilus sp. YIM 151500]|uniref:hypothetical protein n=1 Tax=Geodermatophilus sp. YIM 151500 TaxID=2984531 RepID=UPI0021E4E56A|nr:hypothetical protein [Geodermatophilus sp. YIM 151500]MCV2489260.1 hypothetical protein [Geodermatophilus sp. YIM 151500]
MSLEQDVAAARSAVDEVERACARVTGHFRDTVDVRRLRLDVSRLRDDLDLLCGAQPAAAQTPQFGSVSWDDGMDDGIGLPGGATR